MPGRRSSIRENDEAGSGTSSEVRRGGGEREGLEGGAGGREGLEGEEGREGEEEEDDDVPVG
eukprot:764667-Hanusia_phi.AAC.3